MLTTKLKKRIGRFAENLLFAKKGPCDLLTRVGYSRTPRLRSILD